HAGIEHATHGARQGPAVRVEDREVIQARGPGGGRRCPWACPRVEADVVMIAARREEHRVPPIAARHLEAEHVTVEGKGTVEVGNGEVDVADAGIGVNGHRLYNVRVFHDATTPSV